jgi:DNA oxidative demethylase
VPDWLSLNEQRLLIEQCREWARPPAPMQATKMPNGTMMSVQTVCLGWHWVPYRYSRFFDERARIPVKAFPETLTTLGRRAVADVYGAKRTEASASDESTGNEHTPDECTADEYTPDAALVNYYDATAKMGLHQDKEERINAPVVSISIGDSCIFRFGNPNVRGKPYTDIELRSGDLFVFGGPSRFAYHGVPKILPGTAEPQLGITDGRLNITIRVTGL